MVRNHRLLLVVVVLAVSTSCAPKPVKISPTAIDEVATVAGRPSFKSLTLESNDITLLADRAGVEDDVIRDVAPNLDSKSVWRRSLGGLQDVYDQTPDEVRSNLVGVACDVFAGEITNEAEFEQNIYKRFAGATAEELDAYAGAAAGLWLDLYEASISDDPDAKAAAAITCFTVEQAVG